MTAHLLSIQRSCLAISSPLCLLGAPCFSFYCSFLYGWSDARVHPILCHMARQSEFPCTGSFYLHSHALDVYIAPSGNDDGLAHNTEYSPT
ncbi:hypothetical protein RRG08_024995 [Elysia crispata]|uniref:Uncharacterized protein n=1 Tax=Elysia crispata TaxID=231223 RepID=A0AAE1BE91_9GAST|nr:hypothetical protein RRG08_024995 [Elysia crispata]